MKPSLLILSSLFTTSVYADSKLYAKIGDFLKPTTTYVLGDSEYIIISPYKNPAEPKYTWDKGLMTIGEGDNQKIFGITKDGLVGFGKHDQVKPRILELDQNSQVVNYHPDFCRLNTTGPAKGIFLRKYLAHKDGKCDPVDLYYLSSEEAERRGAMSFKTSKQDLVE